MRNSLLVNDLICWNDKEDYLERVLWIDEGHIIAFCIDVKAAVGFPRKISVSQIKESIERHEAVIIDNDPFATIIREEDLTESQRKVRDMGWAVVSLIISKIGEPDIYIREKRGPIIASVAKEFNISVNTVYRYLRRYWQRGKGPNALLPDYNNSGGRGKSKSAGEKKLGRPRKNPSVAGTGINVDESIKQIFLIAYEEFYKTRKELTLTKTYERMCERYFVENVYFEEGQKKVAVSGPDERPSMDQFAYWVEKYEKKDFNNTTIARKGEKWFSLKGRALKSKSDAELIGPGSLFQIDSTIGDVYLVSRFNREWIIGRPVIYVVIDAFSRMVAGLYVGLEGPSWLGAANALANCAMDKVKFCKDYEIDIEPEEWPIKGLPNAIVADRGELEGKPIETLSKNLHVWIKNTPPYRADFKGIVEQYFHLINTRVKSLLPGAVLPDFKERGGRDYRLDAKLDIYQFTQIMIHCVLNHNRTLMKYYQRGEMMIEDDVPAIPLFLWNWGIANRSGELRYFAEDIVKLNLMPTGTATVTEKGIVFQGMRFTTEQAIKEMWFEQARLKGSWTEDISYDPRNMNYIYLREPGGRSYKVCFLLDSEEVYKNKSYDEIVFLREYEKFTAQKHSQSQLQKRVNLNLNIDTIIETAEKMAPEKEKMASNTARVKEIKPKRKFEREIERENEAFLLVSDQEKNRPKNEKPADVISLMNEPIDDNRLSKSDLFRKKQQEKLYGQNEPE